MKETVKRRLQYGLMLPLFTMLCVFAKPVSAQHALQDYVNNLKTFSARFVQVQPDEALFELNESYGIFKLNRPGQLVWEYTAPTPQKIVIDGVNLWVFDEDLEQVTVRPIDEIKNDLPLSWLLFKEKIEEKFVIIDAGKRNGLEWFNLSPKSATYFQSIEVGMKDGEMVEVWMYQGSERVTKVRFESIESNHVIPLKQFQFEAPEGVDMIGEPL